MAGIQTFLAFVGNVRKELAGAITGGPANAGQLVALDPVTGLLANSMMPINVGPDAVALPTSEALTGPLVNVWDSGSGVMKVRNADASVDGKPADGFVLGTAANATTVEVYSTGLVPGLSGLTPGPAFLSDTTVGQVSSTPGSGTGHVWQSVGKIIGSGQLFFTRGEPVVRA